MIPRPRCKHDERQRIPRESGDDPLLRDIRYGRETYSPRERG